MNHGRKTGRRPYQTDAKAKVIRGFHQEFDGKGPFRRQLGVLATGGGKTVIFADVAEHYHALGESVLVLADQRELVGQAAAKLLTFAGLFAEIEQGSQRASPMARVVCASMQSMANRLDRFAPDRFGIVIADEADRALAPQWQKVLGHFQGHAKIFGLTATPERADKKSVLDYFEDIAFEKNLMELIGEKYLVPIKVRQEPLKLDLTGVGVSQTDGVSDYKGADVAAILEPCFDQICQYLIEHAQKKGRRKVLAFLPLVETSKKFVEACFRNGINARHVDGEMPNRDEIVAGHQRGDFWLLSNAMMLNRGYDDPEIDTIVPLRFTKSASLYRQIVGRGTRLFCPHGCPDFCEHQDKKNDLLLFDFLYEFNRLGPQRPSNLIAATPEEAVAINRVIERTADKDVALPLQFAADEAAREREIALLKQLEKAGKRKGKTFDAQSFAVRLKQRELIDYEPLTKYDQQPASEKQIALLAKWGFTVSTIKGKGHASKLLNVLFARQRHGLASFGQVRFLNNIGDPLAEKRTRDEAREILERHSAYKAGRMARAEIFEGFEQAANPEASEAADAEAHAEHRPGGQPMPEPRHDARQAEDGAPGGGYDVEDEEMDPEHLAALTGDREEISQPKPVPAHVPSDRTASPEYAREGFRKMREAAATQMQLF